MEKTKLVNPFKKGDYIYTERYWNCIINDADLFYSVIVSNPRWIPDQIFDNMINNWILKEV